MSSLESFVNTIRSLYQVSEPGTSSASSKINYLEIYNTINSNLNIFNDNSPSNLLDNVLPIFTLPEYTLPNMAVLYAIITKIQQNVPKQANEIESTSNLGSLDQNKFLSSLESCLKDSDEQQIHNANDVYSELCHFYTNKLIHLNQAYKGLLVIYNSIKKIQYDINNSSKLRLNLLTTVHSDLLKLSLASKNFKLALELISNEILDINKTSTNSFDSKYYLQYFYYSGCILASLKQYENSLFHFEQALSAPASSLSQIMIETYKKYILISLISKGKLQTLPKYISRIVLNQIKPICSVYHELAQAFINYEQEKLNNLCSKYNDLFRQDNNLGLIKQVQQAFYKKNIQKLTKTFITLSLSDMANKVKLNSAKDAENLMLNMIKDGEIFATINQKDGMVSFHDNPEKYDNPMIMNQLTNEMFKSIELDSNIKEMDREITTHPHYIQKCQLNSSTAVDETDQLLQ